MFISDTINHKGVTTMTDTIEITEEAFAALFPLRM